MEVKFSRDIVQPFKKAVDEVFNTMVGLSVTHQANYLVKDNTFSFDVSAIMGITGGIRGHAAVRMTAPLAFNVVGSLLGLDEKFQEVDDTVIDGVGEMVNLISGTAKAQAEKVKFDISIPVVIDGPKHVISNKSDVPNILMVFDVEGERLGIQLAIEID